MLFNSRLYLFAFLTVLAIPGLAFGQVKPLSDSVTIQTGKVVPDTLSMKDSTALSDSTHQKKKGDEGFRSDVSYTAKDSMKYSSDNKKVYLYGKAVVKYEDIELDADYIEFDFPTQIVYASGLPDSTGKIAGKPEFSQKKEKFKAESMHYNFKTKKGVIRNVITEQEGGFLHAEKTKRLDNGHIDLKDGKYTTCDAEHPHFYLALTKGVVIPSDKIVFGPAYLVIADIPMPVGLPFGFFRTNGKVRPESSFPPMGRTTCEASTCATGDTILRSTNIRIYDSPATSIPKVPGG